ncbi:hypothetical protein [Azorhizobium doebereinerae]|uniref:hypothetical protein n=1 Tax=Azorhizobium doebereinerae TaxID=281091 RepID=UPI0005590005|nr:hypothetical protein [Azorhizobium doebereinerae]
MTEPAFAAPEHASDLYRLPSGDWIQIQNIDGARISNKPNRQTGEMGAQVHLNVAGSWHTVMFDEIADAEVWLAAIVQYRNDLLRPRSSKSATRAEALQMVAGLHSRHRPTQDEDGDS